MNDRLQGALAQWHSNRRLRVFVLVAALILVAHVATLASEDRATRIERYRTDQKLLVRLEGAATDEAWSARAEQAAEALAQTEATMTTVSGAGQAQAELQALLAAAASTSGVADAAIRTEGATPVEAVPGVLEVSARLAGTGGGPATTALLRELAAHRWLRIDRLDVRDDASGQIQMIARGYFRLAPEAGAP